MVGEVLRNLGGRMLVACGERSWGGYDSTGDAIYVWWQSLQSLGSAAHAGFVSKCINVPVCCSFFASQALLQQGELSLSTYVIVLLTASATPCTAMQ